MVYIFTFAPTRNIFFKTDEQRAVCNNPLLAVGLGKAFHLLTENGKPPADKKSSAGQRFRLCKLTSHAGLNPRSEHASLSLSALLAELRAGNEREARVINKNK